MGKAEISESGKSISEKARIFILLKPNRNAGETNFTCYPDGETKRQIDRILINHKYRNCMGNAQVKEGRNASMQRQQHMVGIMDICLKLMRR